MEPQTQQQNRKLDKNGDEIIIEGVCYNNGVYLEFFLRTLAVSIISLLGMLIAIPIGIVLAKAAVKSFQLYLTKKSICYHRAYPSFCGVPTWVIPLSYITNIEAVGSSSIWIYMENKRIVEYLGGSPWPFCAPSYLVLSNVKNCEEFVHAVKGEISAFRDEE